MEAKLKAKVLNAQRNEITEHFICRELALIINNQPNKEVLEKISQYELSPWGENDETQDYGFILQHVRKYFFNG